MHFIQSITIVNEVAVHSTFQSLNKGAIVTESTSVLEKVYF
jgi:hypothetical protein